MLRNLPRLQLTLLALVAAGALMAGCGDDDDSGKKGATLTCAEGTKLVGSECVLDGEPITCADGTKLEGSTCVPLETCGEGTIADATGACVPEDAQIECGEGTTLDGESCVPDTTELCQPGTHVEGDRCVPDVICGEGTTAKDGECLTNGDILAAEADVTETEDPNDPAHGGTAQTLDLPAASESLTVAGTIAAPADLNGDGFLNQDFDAYAIEGTAGDYLRIETLNNGASSTSFKVEGPQGYLRFAPSYADHGQRQVFLPFDGTYTITVGPSAQLQDNTLGAQGGDDAGYVMVIENLGDLDLSAATALDATAGANVQGNFPNLGDNLAAISAPGNSLVRITQPEVGPDAGTPTAILLTAAGDVMSVQPLPATGLVAFPLSDDDLHVLVDYEQLKGDRDAYTLSAQVKTTDPATADPIQGGDTVQEESLEHSVAPGDALYLTIDVELLDQDDNPTPQGLLVWIATDADRESLSYRAIDPKGDVVDGFKGFDAFHATLDGTYTIEISNTGAAAPVDISMFAVFTDVPMPLSETPFDATSATSGAFTFPTLVVDEFYFVTFETTEALSATLAATQVTDSDLELYLIRKDTSVIVGYGGASPEIADMPLMEPGRYFGLVLTPSDWLGYGDDAASVNVSLNTAPAPIQATEPNNSVSNATPISALQTSVLDSLVGAPGEDKDVFKLEVDITEPTFGLVTILPVGASNSQVVGELRDANGVLYDNYTSDRGVVVGGVLQPGTDYYVHVHRATAEEDELTYQVTYIHDTEIGVALEIEPNDTDAEATEMAPTTPPAAMAFQAGGTLRADDDVDWYKFELTADSLVAVSLGGIGLGAPASSLTVESFEDDGTGTLVAAPMDATTTLGAGTKYLKVSGANPAGSNNSYQVTASIITSYELGTVATGDLTRDTGTFSSAGMQPFTFEVANDLPADGSQSLVIWSDAVLQVKDASGNVIHDAQTIGAGFSTTSLSAGSYTLSLTGSAGSDWEIYFGILDYTLEDEQVSSTPNDDEASAEDIGALASGVVLHRFGAAGTADDDYFSFEVPDVHGDGSEVSIFIQLLALGEDTSGYEEFYLYTAAGSTVKNEWMSAPIVYWSDTVDPGTYLLKVDQWSSGFDSADYLVRVGL